MNWVYLITHFYCDSFKCQITARMPFRYLFKSRSQSRWCRDGSLVVLFGDAVQIWDLSRVPFKSSLLIDFPLDLSSMRPLSTNPAAYCMECKRDRQLGAKGHFEFNNILLVEICSWNYKNKLTIQIILMHPGKDLICNFPFILPIWLR